MVQALALNYILSSGDIEFFKAVKAEYFNDYKNEYNFINEHFNTYGTIPDVATFISKFDNFDLLTVSEPPKYLLDNLKIDKNKCDLIDMYNKVRKLLTEDRISEAVELSKAASENLSKFSEVLYTDLLDGTKRYDSYIDRCDNKSSYFIKTGFTELDDALGGWDALEELGVISARPNVGKSQIVIKCATAAVLQGLKVGIYSGEMSEEKVGYRADTMLANIPNYDLTRGDRKSLVIYKQYIDALPYKYAGKFWCLTPIGLGKPATVNDLKTFIEDKELDILFVDQHSLLEDQHHAKESFQRAANISKDLKNLLVLKKIPIIAVSQLNRKTTDDDEDIIDVDRLAQSDRIGLDATTVIFLTFKNNILSLIISKSRDCPKGKKLNYIVDWNTGTFLFVPEADDKETDEDDNSISNFAPDDNEVAIY